MRIKTQICFINNSQIEMSAWIDGRGGDPSIQLMNLNPNADNKHYARN